MTKAGGRFFGMRLKIRNQGRSNFFFVIRNLARKEYEELSAGKTDPTWKVAVLYCLLNLHAAPKDRDWINTDEIDKFAAKCVPADKMSHGALVHKSKELLGNYLKNETDSSSSSSEEENEDGADHEDD